MIVIGEKLMNLRAKERSAAVLLSLMLAGTAILPVSVSAENIPPDAIGAVTAGSVTTFYYDTKVSGGLTAMWNDAVTASAATVKLYTDWDAQNGTRLVTQGKGMTADGVICVPSGHEITLDLNGYSIDRQLDVAMEDGEVIYVENGGVLNLTDTKAASGGAGKVTGGYSTNCAGGIEVAQGGTLNLWGGCITGNRTEESGGGIRLNGEGSRLYMTGGSIQGNTADAQGGGIAMYDAQLEIVKGTISDNTAIGFGGGIYQSGGSTKLQSGTMTKNSAMGGGGICTQDAAELSIRGDFSIQNNIAKSSEYLGSGGGIFAMSTLPVKLSGTPDITGNRHSDGKDSNLTFWVDLANPFVGPRIIDEGVSQGAKVGLNFGSEEIASIRELGFAPSWETALFTADGEFEYLEDDGVQYLRRPVLQSDYLIYIWIGFGAVVLIAAAAIIWILTKALKKKKRRKRGKRPHASKR